MLSCLAKQACCCHLSSQQACNKDHVYPPLAKHFLWQAFASFDVQIQVRLQRPTVVAEVGFMLSVTKFFVPGFAMSGITPTPFESTDLVLEGDTC